MNTSKTVKTKKSTRFLSAVLAFVMVVLMVPSAVVATAQEPEASESLKILSPTEKYRIETKESIDKILEYIDQRNTAIAKDEKEKNSFENKIKKANEVVGYIGTAINTALVISNTIDPDDTWYENVGNIALNLACSYFGVPVPGQESESEIMIREIEKMIEQVNTRLDTLQDSVDALSKQVDDNSRALAEYISNIVVLEGKEDDLKDFFGPADSGYYGYYQWKAALHETYKNFRDTVESSDATEEGIKEAYDKLYIVSLKGRRLDNYIFGNNYSESVQMTLYDYYTREEVLQKYKDATDDYSTYIEVDCIDFMVDLYDSYTFSQYCMGLCHNYQLDYLRKNNLVVKNESKYILSEKGYDPVVSKPVEDINYLEIVNSLSQIYPNQQAVLAETAWYLSYVSNLEKTYLYESSAYQGTVFSVPYQEIFRDESFESDKCKIYYGGETLQDTYYLRTNNRVSNGDILYMNLLPDELASMFAAGRFVFVSSDEAMATVDLAGVVNVIGSEGSFTITMKYEYLDEEGNLQYRDMYSLAFEIVERQYAGGHGTETSPFLITEWAHIAGDPERNILGLANNEKHYGKQEIYFKVMNDIDANGATFEGIPSFSGSFDGDRHRIYNFRVKASGYKAIGFFRVTESPAIIKNVILGHHNKQYSSYNNYSAAVNGNLDCDGHFYIGGLCGNNKGKIESCGVENIQVYGDLYWHGNNDLYSYAGGITGVNNNELTKSYVYKSYMYVASSTEKDNEPSPCYAFSGGVAGVNYNTISQTLSYNNVVAGYTYSKNIFGNGSASTYCGGLLGAIEENSLIENSYGYKNSFDPRASAGGDDNDHIVAGERYGFRRERVVSFLPVKIEYLGTITNCDGNSMGTWSVDASGCPILSMDEENDSEGSNDFVDRVSYVRGETHFRYSTTVEEIDPETNETVTKTVEMNYPLSEYRIDTSIPDGEQTITKKVIHLKKNADSSTYQKSEIEISVTRESAIGLEIYSEPHKIVYRNDESGLTLDGLHLVLMYNNGTAKILTAADESKEYMATLDCSNADEPKIVFTRENLNASVGVTLLSENDPHIIVSDGTTAAGGTVRVPISIKNNPGIAMMGLDVSFDENVLELIAVEDAGLLKEATFGDVLKSPYTVNWAETLTTQNNTQNGTIVTFVFRVKDTAPLGDTEIAVTYVEGNIRNVALEKVPFAVVNGTVSVEDYMPGDINGDVSVDLADLTILSRHLADWNDYKTINTVAADVNCDGAVTLADLTILSRYLANWKGVTLG